MRLKQKTLSMTIGILALTLVVSSVVIIQSFRKHYADLLISGSLVAGQSLESLLDEMLAMGLPFQSLSGIDGVLSEIVEKNGHIDYAYVMNGQGEVLYRSHSMRTGKASPKRQQRTPLKSFDATLQRYSDDLGRRYIDISLPLRHDQRYLGKIHLGLPVSVIDQAVMSAVKQLAVTLILIFLLIGLVLNVFLRRQVVEPIKRLSLYAESIAMGTSYHTVRINRDDEIGSLSRALVHMSATLKHQIAALRSGGQLLEEKVSARTRQLATTNKILEARNEHLKLALQRERELSDALRHSEERFRLLFEQNKASMLIIDPQDGVIVAANGVALNYYGYPEQRMLQMRISDINTLSKEEVAHEMQLAQQEQRNHFYFRHKLASGEVREVEVHSGPITWDDKELLYSIVHDVTDRKQAEAELKHIAHYDSLTGLPNRLLKSDRLHQALTRSRRNNTNVAVCYLDLDGFKPINDRYGHDIGDLILIETAQRLQNTVREGDTVSRIGGDEFVLILTDLMGVEQCRLILDRVLSAISQPIAFDDQVLEVCGSIGITLYPDDDADADILMRHADQAMYMAKERGKNRYHLFDPVGDRQIRVNQEKLQRLTQALADDEFVLHYQPKVNMLTCEVVGIEALIRWGHPEQGLLSPGDFLNYLSNTELEIELGFWVIRRALEEQRTLRKAGLELPVSVNISGYHLQHDRFLEQIASLLESLPLDNQGDLEFEILESASIEDMSDIFHTLSGCRDLGIRFSLDDFGTGYSSLAYFHRLPVDNLKIDQTFVQGMLEDPQDLTIVDSVVRLAGAFKHPVIAEGVESLEHGAALLRLGCHLGQGYGIARPMPLEKLTTWKESWDKSPEWQNLKFRFMREQGVDIQSAIENHRQWVDDLIRLLDGGEKDLRIQFNSHHCEFGRWLDGVGYLYYGQLPIYEEIRRQHDAIHQMGLEMSNLASHGFRQEMLARLPEIERARDRFIELVDQMHEDQLEKFEFGDQVSSG